MQSLGAQQILDLQSACSQLYIDYARHVDFGNYGAFCDLFTETAVLDLGFVMEGRAAIAQSMTRRSPELRSRHVMTNIHIEPIDAARASGIAYTTIYRHIGPETLTSEPIEMIGPAAVGHYANEFVLTTEGWRIGRCTLSLAFRDATQFAKPS